MADEIATHGYCGLPGSLRALIKTKRGKDVGALLENLAEALLLTKANDSRSISKFKTEVNELRDENQQLTDLVEKYGDRLDSRFED
jgi:hypothetical protein